MKEIVDQSKKTAQNIFKKIVAISAKENFRQGT